MRQLSLNRMAWLMVIAGLYPRIAFLAISTAVASRSYRMIYRTALAVSVDTLLPQIAARLPMTSARVSVVCDADRRINT